MNQFTIRVELDATPALTSILERFFGIFTVANQPQPSQAGAAVNGSKQRGKSATNGSAPAPAPEAPAAQPAAQDPETTTNTVEAPEVKDLTIVDLRATIKAQMDAGKLTTPQMAEALASFGAGKLSGLDQKFYGAFLEKLATYE